MARPGPRPDHTRASLRTMFPGWSDRTFATWYKAFLTLAKLQELGWITEDERQRLMRSGSRPNGSINVCKFAEVVDDVTAALVAKHGSDDG